MLTTTVERLEGISVKLTITISADEVDAAIERTYKEMQKKVRVPGFRPGKAPKAMLDSMLGQTYILSEATEDLVNSTYPKALDAEKLRPIESPEIAEIEPVVAGTEFTYIAQVDLRPELTLSKTDGFEVEVVPREATDAMIDEQVDGAREHYASLEPVEDRGVEAGDYVLLSFVGTVDGEAYEGNTVDKYLYETAKGLLPSGFDDGIFGMKPEDERHVEFVIEDTGSNPEFAGKTAGFDVTVHEIKRKVLPEADEEFATNMGFESVEAMRADLKMRLDQQRGLQHDRDKERALREELAKRVEGDVPGAMIKDRVERLQKDFQGMLDAREWTMEGYLQMTGVTMETLEADLEEQAQQLVREDLALEALFRALGMEVTDADIDEELGEIGKATGTDTGDARARWEELGLLPVVTEQIQHRKAVYWLMENAKVTEVEPAPEGTESAEGTKSETPKKKAPAKKKAKAEAEADSDAASGEE